MDFIGKDGQRRHKFKLQFGMRKITFSKSLPGKIYVNIVTGNQKQSTQNRVQMDQNVCDFNQQVITFELVTLLYGESEKRYQEKLAEMKIILITSGSDKKLLGKVSIDIAQFVNFREQTGLIINLNPQKIVVKRDLEQTLSKLSAQIQFYVCLSFIEEESEGSKSNDKSQKNKGKSNKDITQTKRTRQQQKQSQQKHQYRSDKIISTITNVKDDKSNQTEQKCKKTIFVDPRVTKQHNYPIKEENKQNSLEKGNKMTFVESVLMDDPITQQKMIKDKFESPKQHLNKKVKENTITIKTKENDKKTKKHQINKKLFEIQERNNNQNQSEHQIKPKKQNPIILASKYIQTQTQHKHQNSKTKIIQTQLNQQQIQQMLSIKKEREVVKIENQIRQKVSSKKDEEEKNLLNSLFIKQQLTLKNKQLEQTIEKLEKMQKLVSQLKQEQKLRNSAEKKIVQLNDENERLKKQLQKLKYELIEIKESESLNKSNIFRETVNHFQSYGGSADMQEEVKRLEHQKNECLINFQKQKEKLKKQIKNLSQAIEKQQIKYIQFENYSKAVLKNQKDQNIKISMNLKKTQEKLIEKCNECRILMENNKELGETVIELKQKLAMIKIKIGDKLNEANGNKQMKVIEVLSDLFDL